MSAKSLGRVVDIWRYPVKSMRGESLNATYVTGNGVLGDRSYALLDRETGKVASAKNPRRWPNLFDFQAAYVDAPQLGAPLPPVRISFPDGETLDIVGAESAEKLTAGVGRPVRLARAGEIAGTAEGYWPDYDWLPQRDDVFEFPLPTGTFFDGASIHLLTTATLDRLRELAPNARFETPRFRPNFVIEAIEGSDGFVENAWVGRTLALGEVHLKIEGPCPRCVMTTLAQGSLPKDPNVLRTIVRENEGNCGVYATVVRAGLIRRGDVVDSL